MNINESSDNRSKNGNDGRAYRAKVKKEALIDVSNAARLVGIEWPVAVTKAVFADCIKWTEDDRKKERQASQNEDDRLCNILFALKWILHKIDSAEVIFFDTHILPDDGFSYVTLLTKLKAVVTGSKPQRSIIIALQKESIGD